MFLVGATCLLGMDSIHFIAPADARSNADRYTIGFTFTASSLVTLSRNGKSRQDEDEASPCETSFDGQRGRTNDKTVMNVPVSRCHVLHSLQGESAIRIIPQSNAITSLQTDCSAVTAAERLRVAPTAEHPYRSMSAMRHDNFFLRGRGAAFLRVSSAATIWHSLSLHREK